MSQKVILLLSGGLDSAANLALAHETSQVLLALTVDYGQRAAPAELRASRQLSEYYGVPHRTVALPWLGSLGGSALTDSKISVPEPTRSGLDNLSASQESARSVWVPNRNGVFVEVAAAHGEVLGAQAVVVGFNREEAVTFPDNSTEYLEALSGALKYSTREGIRVHSHTDRMDKKEIVDALLRLKRPFPFHLVWSCYFAGERPCGKCESCMRYTRATEGRIP